MLCLWRISPGVPTGNRIAINSNCDSWLRYVEDAVVTLEKHPQEVQTLL